MSSYCATGSGMFTSLRCIVSHAEFALLRQTNATWNHCALPPDGVSSLQQWLFLWTSSRSDRSLAEMHDRPTGTMSSVPAR